MSVIQGTAVTGAGDQQYQISRSLRFNSADSAYLNRTPASASNRKTWTWSGWTKITPASTARFFAARVDDNNRFIIALPNTQNNLQVSNVISGTSTVWVATNALLRDPSAWYHIVVAFDSTQATATNRLKVYLNGVEQTFSTDNRSSISQNYDGYVNNNIAHYIGTATTGAGNFSDKYLTEINFIDGSALTPTSFGEFNSDTGVWQPKAYTGSYGTNGFYLDFADNSGTTSTTLGKDSSGNGNNWTPNNFSVTAGAGNDSLVDSPTRYGTDTGAGGEVRGNYCTLNPLWKGRTRPNLASFSDGNLTATFANGGNNLGAATVLVSTGKWYYESVMTGASDPINGWGDPEGLTGADAPGYNTTSIGISVGGDWIHNSSTLASTGTSYTTGDIVQIALDLNNNKIYYGKNGTWTQSGNPAANSGGQALPSGVQNIPIAPLFRYANSTAGLTLNFGQRPFAYTAPSGFKALVTTNLPEPTIADGGEYFNALTYTGTLTDGQGTGATQSVTGVGFQPDFVWIKNRTNANQHVIVDAVRTVTNYRFLASNSTDAENTNNTNGAVSALNADGFTLQNGTDGSAKANLVARDTWQYVAWNWKANGAGVSNTAGTITSTVSVNTTSGFSIVTYTGNGTSGATIGHGLGVAPAMTIIKRRSSTETWIVWHTAFNSAQSNLRLQTTDAVDTNSPAMFNNTFPTSTLITLGNGGFVNTTSETYVCYAFAPVAGYSAFGSYTGNGSADGPFVFTGFRPAFVITKCSSTTARSWSMKDSARSPFNLAQANLSANYSDAEGTTEGIDMLSNGFKIRQAGSDTNTSGETYIFMAFAENPFKLALAR